MQKIKQPYVTETTMRTALVAAGVPAKGRIGIKQSPGWTVNRTKRIKRHG